MGENFNKGKGRVVGVLNLVKVAEEVFTGKNIREIELRKLSNKAKIGNFKLKR